MSDTTKKPVIFLAFANDRDDTVGYLRNLPEEARRLRDVLTSAEQAGLCEVEMRSNSTAADIFKVFQNPKYRNRIAIFHYGGHANGYQLLLESAEGQTAAADAGGLAAFLAQQQGLQLVFLNGCSTQQQTQGLLDSNIPAVISTSRSIDDKVATEFACQFYQGLAGGATIRRAFEEAAAAARTAKSGDMRKLYLGSKGESRGQLEADRWPWDLYFREGSEHTGHWNLPEAVNEPLFGLPPLPEQDLPETPYRHLNWFTRQHAAVFFGRGHQIRELYDRLTAPHSAPIILFYGQSGVGKSSVLDAGLIPRLEQRYEVRYLRRTAGGLLATLQLAFLPEASGEPLESAWRVKEQQTDKPLIVFLDQVEECFTRPIADMPDELDQLLKVVQATFGDPNHRPQGKLVLGFRKEWLAELESHLVSYELPRTKVFLARLDRRGIIEVVLGPTRSERLRERYGLTVEDGLAGIIADDLSEDHGSAIAPTLQILLTKMWTKASEANYEHPHFGPVLYQHLKRDGILLRDFLNQQIAAFRERYPEAVDSGLLLDIVALHTTPLGTANECTIEQLQRQYAHLGTTLPDLLQQCQDLYLLTVAASSQKATAKATRLAHDTLAPLVREQFDVSDKPGQRARRILDNRSVDWLDDRHGRPLDEADLTIVEQGVGGTRVLNADEQRLLNASREARKRRRLMRDLGLTAAIAAVVLIVLSAAYAFRQSSIAKANAGLATRGSINSILNTVAATWRDEPVEALNYLNDSSRCPEEYREFTWQYLRRLSAGRSPQASIPVFPEHGVLPASVVALSPGDQHKMAWSEGSVIEPGKVRFKILYLMPGMTMPEPIPNIELDEDITSLAFSHDGNLLAWHSKSQTPVVWGLKEKRPASLLPKLGSLPWSAVTLSPAFPQMAYIAGDSLHLVDWQTGTVVRDAVAIATLGLESKDVTRIVFSADGMTVFVVGTDKFGALALGDEARVHTPNGKFVCCSPDGRRVVVASGPSIPPKLIDLSGEHTSEIASLRVIGQQGFAEPISASYSRDGRKLVIAYQELDLPGSIAIWDAVRLTPLSRLPGSILPREDFLFAAFVNDASIVTSSRYGWDSTEDRRDIRLWDAVTDSLSLPLPPSPGNQGPRSESRVGQAVTFFPQGHLVAAVVDGHPTFWNVAKRELLRGSESTAVPSSINHAEVIEGHFASCRSLAFAIDGSTIMDDRGQIVQVSPNLRTDQASRRTNYYSPILTSNGQRSVAIIDNEIGVKDADDDRFGLIPAAMEGDVKLVCLSPAGDRIACIVRSSKTGAGYLVRDHVFIRGTRMKDKWDEIPLGDANPTAIAFSPDSESLAVAQVSGSSFITLWSVNKNVGDTPMMQTTRSNGNINAITFSPDGMTLASASDGPGYGYTDGYEGVVRLWDPVTGQLRLSLEGHTWGVTALAFSSDSRKLVSCSNNEVLLWDATDWRPPFKLTERRPSGGDDVLAKAE